MLLHTSAGGIRAVPTIYFNPPAVLQPLAANWKRRMKKTSSIEYVTGFLMGIFFGFFIESVLIMAYNLLSTWQGWVRIAPVWWMLMPVPFVIGLIMGKTIASLHLEDY
jgi:hypothetical protein